MAFAPLVAEALRRHLAAYAPATWTFARAMRLVVSCLAIAVCAHAALRVVGPMLKNPHAMGKHDWDAEASYRYITTLSLLKYHEMPWWHPYLCGGFPAWGYGEMAPNLVSPFLPFHLFLPITEALRVEIVGNTALSLFATWLFVGRFTRNAGLRVLAALAYSINGRFALQITSGHAWHLQYAWTPLALYAFDIACDRGRIRAACWAGATIAMIVYGGGIYPLPHTALAIGAYAVCLAIGRRSTEPLLALGITGATAVGLSAPKLLPIMEVMKRWPRTVDSTETVDLGRLYEMLANPKQTFAQGPIPAPQWGWHEWGIYVGPAVVGCMVVALFIGGGSRFSAARAVGLAFFCLGLGAFHALAPWTLLHELPIFASQHVPSRFVYVAILLMMTAFAAAVGKVIDPLDRKLPWLSLLLLFPAWRIGLDIADVGAVTTENVFYLASPAIEPHPAFVQSHVPEFTYLPPDSRTGAALLAMERNEGYVDCDMVPGQAKPRGAIGWNEPGYKGEAHFASGPGTATVSVWTPSHAVVEYAGATPGASLIYNMNWDPGWDANGEPALDVENAVAANVTSESGRVEFRYRPRSIGRGLLVFFATLLAIGAAPARRLYRRKQLG